MNEAPDNTALLTAISKEGNATAPAIPNASTPPKKNWEPYPEGYCVRCRKKAQDGSRYCYDCALNADRRCTKCKKYPAGWYGKPSGKRGDKTRTPGPRKLLLITHEMTDVLKMTGVDNSTLASRLCDFWDDNEFEYPTKEGTVFIPAKTWVDVKNAATETASVVFVFSAPGFEDYMRCDSVLPTEKIIPLSIEQQRACSHLGHVIYRDLEENPKK